MISKLDGACDMINPPEQLIPNSPSFIGWSFSSGLVSRRSWAGLVSASGRGSVGARPSRSFALSVGVGIVVHSPGSDGRRRMPGRLVGGSPKTAAGRADLGASAGNALLQKV